MSNKTVHSSPLDEVNERKEKDQEQLSQQALGNTDVAETADVQANDDLLRTPKTTGTGGNPAGAAPKSLIVHEDESGEDRYEEGKTNADNEEK